ncbi:alkaline phosphatase [Angustibacter sp. Root456]|uniref:alkaline phosphatase n=1 Tax=Angustibacter sp. Root456 TaxID=1736539 RepID=UPI0006FB0C2D|nr:alkaline phosphatase [Angustibacter sp. Root456]KQX62107.1 alkaline phosphatase [Angustibacter sp. Root456]
MMHGSKKLRVLTVAVGATSLLGSAAASAQADGAHGHRGHGTHAKNVILFIGDGMGDSEITIARNYLKGANGRLAMDSLPMTGAYTTYSVDKDGTINYVTDSAASGTGWATGTKTYNGAISVDRNDRDLPTILELAQRRGFVTGDVTTAELTDATPAVLASHVAERGCQGPANMASCPQDAKENGGPGSIAEQLLDHGVDVLLGGGQGRFAQTVTGGKYAGRTVSQQASAQGYTLVDDAQGLAAATAKQKVLGLFSAGTMPTRWTGPTAQPYTADDAANTTADGTECQPGNAPSGQPSLTQMTSKALSLLDTKAKAAKGKRGFFLQVEGASIDKQDHASNPCAQIGETADFDSAIAEGLRYAKQHPDTLVVVTADHAHTSQIVEYPQDAGHHSPGTFQTLRTADGAPMVISYATVTAGKSQDHTGSEVRIAAKGPQSQRVLGVTNQTDLFRTMAIALGLK